MLTMLNSKAKEEATKCNSSFVLFTHFHQQHKRLAELLVRKTRCGVYIVKVHSYVNILQLALLVVEM